MQIFADPETMAKMSEQFMHAAALGNSVDGLLRTMPQQGQELLAKLATSAMSALKPADVPPAAPAPSGDGAPAMKPVMAEVRPVEPTPAKRS
jgi:hypothetical protein